MESEQRGSLPPSQRFAAVDLIRGFAVCGILLMNIVSFGMPTAAYLNPNAFLGEYPSTHWLYGISHVLADQKFMGLFSLLFGCSAMLYINRLGAQGRKVGIFYYSRMLWLLLFGMLHSLLLWEGDILFFYGLCGLLLYPLRRLPTAVLFSLGLLIFASALLADAFGQRTIENMGAFAWDYLAPTWAPSNGDIAFEMAIRQSGYWEHLAYRDALPTISGTHPLDVVSHFYVLQGLARALGLMLIGMAFYSWGIVTGQRSRQFYWRWMKIGLGLGIPIASFGLWQNYQHHWDIRYGLFFGMAYNHVATLLLVMAYLSGFTLLHLHQVVPHFRRGVEAIGRMAFSNYIGQSLLCTIIFYGHGLGLFGELHRWQLLLIVPCIWLFQFYFSLAWLRFFRYGPLEWLWRTLTFGRPVPMIHR